MAAYQRYFVFAQLLGLTWLLVMPTPVQAQEREKCAEERAQAESSYLEGLFDQAITQLQPCLDREDLFADEVVQVYRLLSLVHMNNSDLEQAQQAIRDLLQVVPTYQPDPVQDPPSYTTMVSVIQQEQAALAEAEAARVAQEEQEAAEEAATQEQPQADPPEVSPELLPPAEEQPVVTPIITPSQRKRLIQTPRSWLFAAGGAVVVATAVALAFGGGGESRPGPPPR